MTDGASFECRTEWKVRLSAPDFDFIFDSDLDLGAMLRLDVELDHETMRGNPPADRREGNRRFARSPYESSTRIGHLNWPFG